MSKVSFLRAIDAITNERVKQLAKGFDDKHDAAYSENELVLAAICYALPEGAAALDPDGVPLLWPWDASFWHSEDRKANLTKAITLLVAELERIYNGEEGSSILLPPGVTL